MILKEEFKNFKRTWVHHTGMQLATLTVLAATFTVVAFVFSFSMNLRNILSTWGESVQMTVYLHEDVSEESATLIRGQVEGMRDVAAVEYVNKEKATGLFKTQMATYAPSLLQDTEFSHPFPASLRVSFKPGVETTSDAAHLEAMASRILAIKGVEDVSYGQSWVKNYSKFVGAIASSGWAIIGILLVASLFVVGNSVRAAISSRREEIEILELVGATPRMIRAPYVFEGAFMGLMAAMISIVVNLAIHYYGVKIIENSLAFTRLSSQITFLSAPLVLAVLLLGGAFGAIGAYLTVRRLNDGWAASQRA